MALVEIKDKKTGAVLHSYEGEPNQKQFGGPWGDPNETEHVLNPAKEAQLAQERAQSQAKAEAKAKAVADFKAKDLSAVTTVAELRAVLKLIQDAMKD